MSNVNVNRAIAMALAGNYKIGGDGEMMVQEEIFTTDSTTGIYEKGSIIPLTKKYTDYDLIEIHCRYFSHLFSVKSIKEHMNNKLGIILDQIWMNQSNANLQLSFFLNFSDESITIQDVRGTGDSGIFGIKKIYGIKFTGTKSVDYSTEEQVIGKWIDGKPLYRKVFPFDTTVTINSNSYAEVPINISYIDKIIDNTVFSINFVGVRKNVAVQVHSTNKTIYLYNFSSASTTSGGCMIEYTKTTD